MILRQFDSVLPLLNNSTYIYKKNKCIEFLPDVLGPLCTVVKPMLCVTWEDVSKMKPPL